MKIVTTNPIGLQSSEKININHQDRATYIGNNNYTYNSNEGYICCKFHSGACPLLSSHRIMNALASSSMSRPSALMRTLNDLPNSF